MKIWKRSRNRKTGGEKKVRNKKKRSKPRVRSETHKSVGFLISEDAYNIICTQGYTRLDRNPEILTGCRKIADLISSMTIYLMSNTEKGDERIINALSRQVDITPNGYMTRKTWMEAIVMNLLLYGHGNSVVVPLTKDGMLDDMIPISPANVSFIPDGYQYNIYINGIPYGPSDVLHFVLNPDPDRPWKGMGITAAVKDVANNLKQAAATQKAFMESKWRPSVIVKVDGMADEFSSPNGRHRLAEEYLATNETGEPWLIPADMFEVEQIKPLSLSDLAIKDTVELDKRTVAAILGVPAFVLGIGSFGAKEWDNFINSTIRSIAQLIEQELTRKLLVSPQWYWKFNIASLYSYDLKTTANVFSNLYVRGIVTGNEVRDKLSMGPMEGLDNLVILENFIPIDKIGDQLKLKQGGGDKNGKDTNTDKK